MRLCEILSVDRIATSDSVYENGIAILGRLAELLCLDGSCDRAEVFRLLREREQLLSTGIGDGVAIPHTPVPGVKGQRAALVLCRDGVEFDAIDKQPVKIFFGVIGPKSEASEHLKILAKLSRLLRSPETRRRLLESSGPAQAYSLIEEHEAASFAS